MPEPIALITGATSGIGRAAAAQLASAGWRVWVAGRSLERAEATAEQTGGRPLQLDVTKPASVAAAAAVVTELDVLVNNAGISPDYSVLLADADAELFRRTYETNVFAVVTVTNAFLPALRRSGHPRIVNLSSGTGSLTWSSGPNPQFDYQQAASTGGRLAAYRSSKGRPQRPHALVRPGAGVRALQGQRPRARRARHQPQPGGGGPRGGPRGSGSRHRQPRSDPR